MEPSQDLKKEDQVAQAYGRQGNQKKGGKKKAEKFLRSDHTDSNMLVAVRIRPLNQREVVHNDYDIIRTDDKLLIALDKVEMECESEGKRPEMLHRSKEQRYYFDRIFPHSTDTVQVYRNTCAPLIESVVRGYNACIFAYGTTGSGKTHTMVGNSEDPGIMYLIIKEMFGRLKSDTEKSYEIKVSYVEIYNEVIRDLLVANSKETYLDLRDDPDKGVCISCVTEFEVQEPAQVMSLLQIGNRRRTTESTNANQTSSRSHAVLQIILSSKDKQSNTENEVFCGKLSLIDLAGSERGTVTENRGQRLREGAKINTSLLALANCINALGDKDKKGSFVPFRDSKLTRMLKDSLGGNCKTVMIATISPASSQNEETINTLKYANRAKNIKMRVEPNKKMVYLHVSAYKSIISDLKDEIDKLKAQLQNELGSKSSSLGITKPSSDIPQINNLMPQNDNQDTKPFKESSSGQCKCDSRVRDEEEKKVITTEIAKAYEEIIQLEQALIELDEQNTLNALEIRKREAKIFILQKQIEEMEEYVKNSKENLSESNNSGDNQTAIEVAELQRNAIQHNQQIEILSESTKQNLIKRQTMKNELYESYQQIKQIRLSIDKRITNQDVDDYLELVIKNNFLESQNVQLLLNLQLQARTIMDLKNMVTKQQKYIEDNDIGSQNNVDKNLDLFLDGGELDFEDQEPEEEQYNSDCPTDQDKQKLLGIVDSQHVNPSVNPAQKGSNPAKKGQNLGQIKKQGSIQQAQSSAKKASDNNVNSSGAGLSIVGSGMTKSNNAKASQKKK